MIRQLVFCELGGFKQYLPSNTKRGCDNVRDKGFISIMRSFSRVPDLSSSHTTCVLLTFDYPYWQLWLGLIPHHLKSQAEE